MDIKIFYTKANVSGFDFSGNGFITEKRDGERYDKLPKKEFYTLVSKHTIPNRLIDRLSKSSDEILEDIFLEYNTGMPSEITRRIKEEGLDTAHSSMSIGDVIQLNDDFYAVDAIGFKKLENF